MAITMAPLSLCQNSRQDFLAAHNDARAPLGLSPLTWNHTVSAYAPNYANIRRVDCKLEHSQERPYGENIAMGFGKFTAVDAVKLWVDEKPYYDYKSNSCVGGEQCLHYTQVVWQNTEEIGCTRVQCRNEWWFVTCNYYPPGNYIGQRPY
ncbi:pathogenesis-related leaf protein 6-like [Actinidia eriantha]|uniref:pathogenesis-related leaf protein 6-like n=1 Tax=Actinidia eriantha TaxID=165200 RepID=UPI0025859C9A|nr:pathogenesis-related leaf protein 6-like [Actinidia eriantha]